MMIFLMNIHENNTLQTSFDCRFKDETLRNYTLRTLSELVFIVENDDIFRIYLRK